MLGNLFSFHSMTLHRASLISCILSFSLSCCSSMSCGLQWLLSEMSIRLCTRLMQYITQCSLNMMGIQICKSKLCYNINGQYVITECRLSNTCSGDAMCGTNYQLSSGDVIILHTLFKYSNNVVNFHLPDSFRFYKQVQLFFVCSW
jgi:hypothetical protein